jgi:hypothetical protein
VKESRANRQNVKSLNTPGWHDSCMGKAARLSSFCLAFLAVQIG